MFAPFSVALMPGENTWLAAHETISMRRLGTGMTIFDAKAFDAAAAKSMLEMQRLPKCVTSVWRF